MSLADADLVNGDLLEPLERGFCEIGKGEGG